MGESDLGFRESRDGKNLVVNEAMDVTSEGGENEIGESELGLPESRDEKKNVFTGENTMGESDLGFRESRDGKNLVVNEAMDVTSDGGENKKVENELGLPEPRDEINSGEGVGNKMGESELGLAESRDGLFLDVTEAMDVLSEEGDHKMGKSELGLPESRDEKSLGEGVENEKGERELGLPESMDEKKLGEGGENKNRESELGPESRDEKTHLAKEAMDVSSDGGENKMGESELGSAESRDEKSLIVTKEIDGKLSVPSNVEVGISSAQSEKAVVTPQTVISEEKTVKDEAVDEKSGVQEKEEVLPLCDDASNQDHLVSNSVTSHWASKDSNDFEIAPSENVELDRIDSALVMSQMEIHEEKTIKDEEEVLPLSDDALNQDQSGSDSATSHGATKEAHDGQILRSEVILNPNGNGPENVHLVNASEGGEPLSTDTAKDDTFRADTKCVNADGDCDNEAKIVDEKEGFAAESKDFIVKSDVLASDAQNDSHDTKFESHHENEREEAIGEEFDVVMDFKDGASDINPPDLSCAGNDESLETSMVCPNHVVMNEDKKLDVEIQVDTNENQANQHLIAISEVRVVDDGGLSENVEEVVSQGSLECQENAETSDHAVEKLGSINIMPSEVISVADVSGFTQASILPEIAEKSELPFDGNNVFLIDGCEIAEEKNEEKRESDRNYHDAMEIDSGLGNEQLVSEADELKLSNEESVKPASPLKMNRWGYFSSPENEGRFAVSDLVWGKVRSHPWWPGQIFDPADASENAVKYYKKDSYLVAYFGDRTFAWNDSSLLKPFRSHFPLIEKQSNSEGFQNAVNSALEEVSRRVELGLACSCIPKDKCATIKAQIVENTGIREESSKRYGVDHSTRASYFEPDKLIEYVRGLAPRAFSGPDRLDLVITRAQLSAFYCFKGYRPPTIFPSPGELLEIDAEKISSDEIMASHKRKHVQDSTESRKERSLTELMSDAEYDNNEDESFGKKRKSLDPLTDGYDKRVSIYAAKVSTLANQNPPNKPSFRIGECIRRVASQLTGSASSGKDEMVIDGSQKIYEHPEKRSMVLSIESFSVNEMLSQLERVAEEPKKRHNFINLIHTFFIGFRNSVTLYRRGRKRRPEQTSNGPAEEFEFDDDVNDSYWTDRIVQNYSEEQLLNNRVNGPEALQLMQFGAEKPMKMGRKPHSRKRYSEQTAVDALDERVKRRKQESSPAELILYFAERNSIPSEIRLNKMFRRFGPLMESETEVDYESGCAKVIFKRGSDAEVARDSSEKFNIFGPVLVNYHISYEPLISVKVLPLALSHPHEDAILMQ